MDTSTNNRLSTDGVASNMNPSGDLNLNIEVFPLDKSMLHQIKEEDDAERENSFRSSLKKQKRKSEMIDIESQYRLIGTKSIRENVISDNSGIEDQEF